MQPQIINADLALRAVVNTKLLGWIDSPVAGVQRKMIERDGGELARATSVVRYAAGSSFSEHNHDLGEEVFVLEGVFEDEHGSYPTGTYLKNPAGSSHTPLSTQGCTLLVKLRHLNLHDSIRVVKQTAQSTWFPGTVEGLSVMPLDEYGTQHTALVRWAPETYFNPHRHFGGEEIFVLDGVFEDEHGRYEAGTWIRSPHMSAHKPFSREGCTILVKTGHLLVEE
jgi:anti-sigma factor ChrR (cupin superfamily)